MLKLPRVTQYKEPNQQGVSIVSILSSVKTFAISGGSGLIVICLLIGKRPLDSLARI
jgi:hypothetical protein